MTWMDEYEAIKEGAVWRLVHTQSSPGGSTGENATSTQEVVASLQGIICKKDLPPFVEKIG